MPRSTESHEPIRTRPAFPAFGPARLPRGPSNNGSRSRFCMTLCMTSFRGRSTKRCGPTASTRATPPTSGTSKSSRSHYPNDYPIGELANSDVSYTVTVKGIKRRVLPDLDDEFAKDLGEFETLDALRTQVRSDLEHEAQHAAERAVRSGLM